MEESKCQNRTLPQIIVLIVLVLISAFLLKEIINYKKEASIYLSELEALKNEQIALKDEQILIEEEKEIAANKLKELEQLVIDNENNKALFYANALKLEEMAYYGKTSARVAYITVDDGPNKETTKLWLEILEKHNVLATFFVNGKEGLDEEYLAMIKAQHTIGNHTYSHDIFGSDGIYASSSNFMEQISKLDDFMIENYNYKMKLVRFPGGSAETYYLGQNMYDYTSKVESAGFGWINWNILSGDADRSISTDEIVSNVLNTAKYRTVAVILMHDDSTHTIDALDRVIDGLEEMGFVLLPLQYGSIMVYK